MRARESLSRLNSEQIPPPLGEGRGRKRRHPPPQGARSPHVHDAVEFTGQYMGMPPIYSLTGPKTATVTDLCLGHVREVARTYIRGLPMRRLQSTPNDRNRPKAVIQVSCRERPLSDRKADIAYEEIIVLPEWIAPKSRMYWTAPRKLFCNLLVRT